MPPSVQLHAQQQNHAPDGNSWRVRLRLQTLPLQPAAGYFFTLRTLLFQAEWPRGGFVWQTPVDMQAETPQGYRRLWLLDWTRLAILTLGLWLFLWNISRK